MRFCHFCQETNGLRMTILSLPNNHSPNALYSFDI
jgi:hypothetical protein